MPLSDHEQQLLDQLEKQLRSEDPRFARNISETQAAAGGGTGLSAKRFVVGVLLALVGLGAAIFGITLASSGALGIVLGVVGFAVMVAGVYWAFSHPGHGGRAAKSGTSGSGSPQSGAAKSKGSAGFMNRMEDRWDKRRRGE